jgi:Tfp pilus assembly protein PilZ
MNEFISILLKSSLSIALLYLIYTLFLKRDTFFKTNRIYLVSTMIISLIIPFIDFSKLISSGEVGYTVWLDPVVISSSGVQASVNSNPGFYQILLAIYLTGLSIFAIRFLYQLLQLFALVRKYGVSRKEGMNIVFTDRTYSPFSFFNLVFLNNDDIHSSETQKILAHEKVHIRQWHSVDLILLELLTISFLNMLRRSSTDLRVRPKIRVWVAWAYKWDANLAHSRSKPTRSPSSSSIRGGL